MNQRLPFRLLLAVALVLSVSALGRDLPDFNIRANARPALRNPSKVVPGVPGQIASRDERTGSPTFIWANPSHTSAACVTGCSAPLNPTTVGATFSSA